MSRMQHKIYCQQNRKRRIRRFTLYLTLVLIAVGMLGRFRSSGMLTVDPLVAPTATPLSAAFDETPVSRQIILPDSVWYALQTGIFSDAAAAEKAAALYSDRGAPGYILRQNGKYRVLIACYGSRDAAESVRSRLSEKQSVETYIFEWSADELGMQMSGMAGQLDVVEAGLSLLHDTSVQLRDLASGCDSGEYTLEEGLAVVSGIQSQLTLLRSTLASRFSQPRPAFVTTELSELDAALSLLVPLNECSTTTDLSARLKLQAMALYEQLHNLRAILLDM